MRRFLNLFVFGSATATIALLAILIGGPGIGPVDFRAQRYAHQQLRQMYGVSINPSDGETIWTFKSEEHETGGVYQIGFRYGAHRGFLLCRYDSGLNEFKLVKIDEISARG
jgi:hypothetical protein